MYIFERAYIFECCVVTSRHFALGAGQSIPHSDEYLETPYLSSNIAKFIFPSIISVI